MDGRFRFSLPVGFWFKSVKFLIDAWHFNLQSSKFNWPKNKGTLKSSGNHTTYHLSKNNVPIE